QRGDRGAAAAVGPAPSGPLAALARRALHPERLLPARRAGGPAAGRRRPALNRRPRADRTMASNPEPRPRSCYRRLLGREIHYTEWGEPTAPVLLAAHGLARTGRDMDDLAAWFAG